MEFKDILDVIALMGRNDLVGGLDIIWWYKVVSIIAFVCNGGILLGIAWWQNNPHKRYWPMKYKIILHRLGWIVGPSFILGVLSILIIIAPIWLLFIIGLNGAVSLRHLSYSDNLAVFWTLRVLAWCSAISFGAVIYVLIRPDVRNTLRGKLPILSEEDKGDTPDYPKSGQEDSHVSGTPKDPSEGVPGEYTPQVPEQINEGTPKAPEPEPEEGTPPSPSPPLPVVAGLLAYPDKTAFTPIALKFTETTLGQKELNKQDETISEKHIYISYENEKFTLTDISTHNSSWFKGKRIKEHHLRKGDVILLGKTKFLFDCLPLPTITVSFEEDKISYETLPITIGGSQKSDVRLLAPEILDVHAEITFDFINKVFLLNPQNGAMLSTFEINNNPVSDRPPWPLVSGSKVKICGRPFTISYEKD